MSKLLKDLKRQNTDLETKLAEITKKYELASCPTGGLVDRVRNLEQQLAENNEFFNAFACKDFNEFKDFISTFMLTPHEEQTLIRELKQQLAEKDKEIEKLKTKQELTFMHSKEDYFQRCNFLEEENIKLQFTQTQLAITELEKLKEDLFNQKELVDFGKYARFMVDIADILEIINNQINELKKG